jgi:hypothetical protein
LSAGDPLDLIDHGIRSRASALSVIDRSEHPP